MRLPECPWWCQTPDGHDTDSVLDGRVPVRCHERLLVEVCCPGSSVVPQHVRIYAEQAEHLEDGGRFERMPVALFVSGLGELQDELAADDARAIARGLATAADYLDQLSPPRTCELSTAPRD